MAVVLGHTPRLGVRVLKMVQDLPHPGLLPKEKENRSPRFLNVVRRNGSDAVQQTGYAGSNFLYLGEGKGEGGRHTNFFMNAAHNRNAVASFSPALPRQRSGYAG